MASSEEQLEADLTAVTSAPAASLPTISAVVAHTPVSTKRKAAPASPGEKRLKRYRSSCPIAIRQRIDRAQTQRLYLVEPPKPNGDHRYDFVVMGSTGNIYSVGIGNLAECTCPDHAKGNVCKHILFVLLKVVGLPAESPLVYQAALLNSELDDIFTQLKTRIANLSGGVMANDSVQKAYQELGSPNAKTEDEGDTTSNVRRQSTDGDCPICFDPLSAEKLVFCQGTCGANFHATCMSNWKRNQRGIVTCPNCRTPWPDEEGGAKSKNPAFRKDYANLGRLQGQDMERDEETYSDWFRQNGASSGGRRKVVRRRR